MEENNAIKETKVTKCLNCGTEFEGNFCPECGQRADTGRFTVAFIFHNLIQGILSNDGGVWITLKSLFTRPSRMMMDVINGKRKSYFSPFPMLFLALSLYVVIFTFTGSKRSDFDNMFDDDLTEVTIDTTNMTHEQVEAQIFGQKAKAFIVFTLKFFQRNYTAAFVLTIPVYILSARLAYGRKNRKKYNWGEYCVPMVYSLVLLVLYRCLTSIVFYFSPTVSNEMDSYMFIVNITIFTACFKKMMGFSMFKTVWRSSLAFVFYWVLLISMVTIIGIAGIAIAYASVSA